MLLHYIASTLAGSPRIYIPQINHAEVSALLASAWSFVGDGQGALDGLSAPWREQVHRAIRSHDDGWKAWDSHPVHDPKSGFPFDFNELPLAESLTIWSRSVAACEPLGPLAAWMVSGHFAALLQHSDDHHRPLASSWLRTQAERSDEWLAKLRQAAEEPEPPELQKDFQSALELLQFFDAMSVAICSRSFVVAERNQQAPPFPLMWKQSEYRLRFKSCDLDSTRGELHHEIEVAPWPFATDTWQCECEAEWFASDSFCDPDEAARSQETGDPVRIAWKFVP